MQYEFLVMWCYCLQCQHHIMPTALSMAQQHSPDIDNQNEVKHDFFGHVLLLVPVLASCEVNAIVNSTIAFLRSKRSTWPFRSCDIIGASVSVAWHWWHHCISWVMMMKMRCNMTIWSCDTISPVSASCDSDVCLLYECYLFRYVYR